MKATVKTIDGMNFTQSFDVSTIKVWFDKTCNHPVNDESLQHLLNEAKTSKMMTFDPQDESVDAFVSTPIYTAGQMTVSELIVDGITVWSRYMKA